MISTDYGEMSFRVYWGDRRSLVVGGRSEGIKLSLL
jgi:hypothetical protein